MSERLTGVKVKMVSGHFSHRNVVVFASFVRGGDVGQVLDDLLGVLCLASTRLTSEQDRCHREADKWKDR